MEMELLRCIICPKQPSFSDVSHLLTHVSSKGHLSHLHKLQVRSHQEIEAGHRLASYNLWYQHHGIADSLSERMQQKQAKQASKRAGNSRRAAAAATEDSKRVAQALSIPELPVSPWSPTEHRTTIPHQSFQAVLRNRRRVMQEEMDDPDYIPVFPQDNGLAVAGLSRFTAPSAYPDLPSHTTIELPNFHAPITPECSKLKGIIWPGMAIFDAATQERQKKRNQKKDGSVLRHMQANSILIEPLEATYSPGGTMRRKRHMNDLECDTDLIRGETPVKKQSTTRKKKPITKAARKSKRRSMRQSKAHKSIPSIVSIASKSTSISPITSSSPDIKQTGVHSRVSSLQDHNISPQLERPVRKPKKPKSEFSIFTDDAPALAGNLTLDTLPNPFLDPRQLFEHNTVPALPSLQPAPWSRPQALYPQVYDPFKDYRQMRTCNTQLHDIGIGKENTNPLSWKHEGTSMQQISPMPALDGSFDDFGTDLGSLGEVYAYTKNPLVDDFFFQGRNDGAIQTLR